MRIESWREQGQMHTIDGRQLFCAQAGEGETVLLLHAYPTASWGWHRMWPALSARHHVVAPDLLGSGFSDKPAGRHYAIDSLADQLETLLDRLEVRSMHILAHAYGVTTAQELLARRIDRDSRSRNDSGPEIHSVCFVNGGLFPEGTHPILTQKLLLSPIGGAITKLAPFPFVFFKRKLRRAFGAYAPPTDETLYAIWQLLRFNNGNSVVPDVLQYLRERHKRRDRWVGALTNSPAPLCLINGADDPVSGQHIPPIWQRLLPESPLVQLDPRIGHYPPLEDPQGVLNAFFAFIKDKTHTEEPSDRPQMSEITPTP